MDIHIPLHHLFVNSKDLTPFRIWIRDDWKLTAVGIPDKCNDFNLSLPKVRCKVRLSEGFAEKLTKIYKGKCVLKIIKTLSH